MKKSECSPEAWARYTASARAYYHANRDVILARQKKASQTEAYRERRRAFDMQPEQVDKRRAREQVEGFQKAKWEKIKSDPEKLEKKRAAIRKHRTGMDKAMYDQLLELQDGKCGICKKPFEKDRKETRTSRGKSYPCADHCHDSNEPRGLLCHNCNTIEGHVRSRGIPIEEYMQLLHDYLKNPPKSRLS